MSEENKQKKETLKEFSAMMFKCPLCETEFHIQINTLAPTFDDVPEEETKGEK